MQSQGLNIQFESNVADVKDNPVVSRSTTSITLPADESKNKPTQFACYIEDRPWVQLTNISHANCRIKAPEMDFSVECGLNPFLASFISEYNFLLLVDHVDVIIRLKKSGRYTR